jgi:hypothetical protein
VNELNKKILGYYDKHHFYSSVPEMLIYGNFSIAIIIAIQSKILMGIEPIKTISWAVICIIFFNILNIQRKKSGKENREDKRDVYARYKESRK